MLKGKSLLEKKTFEKNFFYSTLPLPMPLWLPFADCIDQDQRAEIIV